MPLLIACFSGGRTRDRAGLGRPDLAPPVTGARSRATCRLDRWRRRCRWWGRSTGGSSSNATRWPIHSPGSRVCGADRTQGQAVVRVFSEREWSTIQSVAQGLEWGGGWELRAAQRLRFFLDFAYATRLRVSEVVDAKLGQIETAGQGDHWLHLIGKGGKAAKVALPSLARSALDHYLMQRQLPVTLSRRDPATALIGSIEGEPVIPIALGGHGPELGNHRDLGLTCVRSSARHRAACGTSRATQARCGASPARRATGFCSEIECTIRSASTGTGATRRFVPMACASMMRSGSLNAATTRHRTDGGIRLACILRCCERT